MTASSKPLTMQCQAKSRINQNAAKGIALIETSMQARAELTGILEGDAAQVAESL